MKPYIKYAAAAALSLAALSAQGESLVRLSDINIRRAGDKLDVAMDIIPREIRPGRDNEVIFTPVLISQEGADSLFLPAVRIAGRNRYYTHVRNRDIAPGEKVYPANSREVISYRREVPYQAWMERSRLDMRQQVGNCCRPLRPDVDTPLAVLDFEEPRLNAAFRFVELTGDSAMQSGYDRCGPQPCVRYQSYQDRRPRNPCLRSGPGYLSRETVTERPLHRG